MNKKFISGALVIMLLTASLPAFAAPGGPFAAEGHAFQLLQALGVIKDDNIEDWEAEITRGEFARYLAALIVQDTAGFPNTSFSDVDVDYGEHNAIAVLAAYEVINGYENGEFRPDDTVTVQEAIKMIVCAMGYELIAKEKGGYPMGYIQIAATKGIIKNTDASFSENLQLWQSLIMLSNMLESDISNSVFNGIYQPSGKTKGNYMSDRLSVYKIKGVVTDNGITALEGKTSVRKEEIVLDGVIISNVPNSRDLLGKYAEVYYRLDEESDSRGFLYCRTDDSRNKVIKLVTPNISGYENMTYSYQTDEFSDIERIRLDVDFVVIYNGKAAESAAVLTQDLMKPAEGDVTLIDNDGDGLADVIRINAYRTIVVGHADRSNYMIADKNDGGFITLDKESIDYRIEDDAGNSADFDSIIAENTVLSYAESLDESYAEIIYSKKTITGAVIEINSENELIISGGSFRASRSFKKGIVLGDKGTFYLNLFGEIAYYEPDADGQKIYAYVIGAAPEGGLRDEVTVRVFTQEQELKNYKLADKVNIDGAVYKDGSKKIDALNILGIRRVVRIRTDPADNILEIDTPHKDDVEGESSINIIPNLDNAIVSYYYTNAMFGGFVSLRNDCLVFLVPAEFDEDQLRVINTKEFEVLDSYSYKGYPVTAYRTNEHSSFAEAVTVTKDITGVDINDPLYAGDRDIYFVEKVSVAINPLGDECNKLTLIGKNGQEEFHTANKSVISFVNQEETYKIEPGDVILFGYDKNRLVNEGNIRVIYDESEDWFNTAGIPGYSPTSYNTKNNIRRSWCYSVEEGFVKYAPGDPSVNTFDKYALFMYKHDFNNTIIFNRSVQKSRTGSAGDLRSFDEYGQECSMFISKKINNYSGGLCVIYEN